MKKKKLLLSAVLMGLLLNGCSTKEVKVEKNTEVSQVQHSNNVEVEVLPVSDKKVEVITKVKPEVAVVTTEKLNPGEVPVVVVNPVSADVPVKEVNILPVKNNHMDIVTKVQPTIELIEELPIEGAVPTLVIDPLVE